MWKKEGPIAADQAFAAVREWPTEQLMKMVHVSVLMPSVLLVFPPESASARPWWIGCQGTVKISTTNHLIPRRQSKEMIVEFFPQIVAEIFVVKD